MTSFADTRSGADAIAANFRRCLPGYVVEIIAPLFAGDRYTITVSP